jgi:hypothetical protein
MTEDTTPRMLMRVRGREYDITPPWTNRELHQIKQVSGVRAGQIQAAIEDGDTDILVALAHVAIRRADKPRPTLDELWDMEAGDIILDLSGIPDDEDGEDGPPAEESPDDGKPGTTRSSRGRRTTAASST